MSSSHQPYDLQSPFFRGFWGIEKFSNSLKVTKPVNAVAWSSGIQFQGLLPPGAYSEWLQKECSLALGYANVPTARYLEP